MKKLITAGDVQKAAGAGQKELAVDKNTIVTPAARDMARELGVRLVENLPAAESCVASVAPAGSTVSTPAPVAAVMPAASVMAAPVPAACATPVAVPAVQPPVTSDNRPGGVIEQVCRQLGGGIDTALVTQIVKEVLVQLGVGCAPAGPRIERDPSGIRLVHGQTVTLAPFDTGKPGDKVALADLLPVKESPRMAAGFMTMENTAFDWELNYDEYDYIIEGTLQITIDGRTYTGQAGDVFYIPRGSKITFGCPDRVKFFYVTYPANWQEVSN
ncbi:cupin domain-containing protein [Desulfurispora thermophila]|uniref:cupin domain-containing protein n=1 Tax=Desulfurispora thermophila TaxID=265470 RepID=UPI00037C7E3A|nr:cupin domain-containing protein [Desulfurispora thermophila]